MNRIAAEQPGGVAKTSPAVHEELAEVLNRPDGVARSQWGWDPYEVWRTRLKPPSVVTQQREALLAGEARAAGPAVAHDP